MRRSQAIRKLMRRQRRPSELLLVPMIDIFTVLVTFLLMTAIFSRTVVLDLKLPSNNASFPELPKGLNLEVIVRRDSLTVADRGIGIPAGEHARIFEKFYRMSRSDTQGRRGSGVGLALVRHVAEAHGGAVTVESAPGEGSRFTLWLPLGRR